ncbi:symbiosis island integrase [Rubellimicrobium mesophilum DSM 19309]|uniref:Symbiosis island integrase n=1 Tax=Rubellimicrobium mesophilum DSM 19309 TaxID=442562 RepID=A0A017HIN7_9RHOB|nr:symbiosis island integrase [Rubellimicrobium mesophilum DSM 19309]
MRSAKPRDKDYKLTDSAGLYLLVAPSGGKLWRLKYRMHGVERKLALGRYPEMALSEARKARDAAREEARTLLSSSGASGSGPRSRSGPPSEPCRAPLDLTRAGQVTNLGFKPLI